MRWGAFIIFGLLAVVIDSSLSQVLLLGPIGNITPSFVVVILVYVSLFAPRSSVLIASWGLGMLVDLMTDLPQGLGGAGPMIGPHALGYTFAAFMLIQIRAMLFRRRSLTVGLAAFIFSIAAAAVAIGVSIIHSWYPAEHVTWADLRPAAELLRQVAAGAYTGLLAFVLARPLMWLAPLFGFRLSGNRGIGRM